MKNASFRKKLSFLLPVIILLVISLLDMYGARFISNNFNSNLTRQCIWIIIGLLSLVLVNKININVLYKYSALFYWLGCLSLLLVLFFGSNINGASSWFQIGPVSIQPSELFKFFYIIHISKIIGKSKKESGIQLFIKVLLLSSLPCLLIFLEPDSGVTLMYILMMFGIIFGSKIEKKYPFALIASGVVALGLFFGLYFFNGDLFTKIFGYSFFYRIDRLLSFQNATSYQLSNALIGVGASGLFGYGLTHKKMYIPEVTTDFVFDLTICNFGLLAGILVTVLYAIILYKLYKEASKVKNQKTKCIISGVLYMMSFQVVEHIFMNLGLTPITGITLPFLSYGGSSLLSYFLLFGLIIKITTNSSSYS